MTTYKYTKLMDLLFEYDKNNYNKLYDRFADNEAVKAFENSNSNNFWRYNLLAGQIQSLELRSSNNDFIDVCKIIISEMEKNKISLLVFN